MGVVMGVVVILLNTVVSPCLSMSHDPEKKNTKMFKLVENMHNNRRKGHLNQKENGVIIVEIVDVTKTASFSKVIHSL